MHFNAVYVLASALAAANAAAVAKRMPAGCPLDNCLFAKDIPALVKPIASTFCEDYIHSTPGVVTVTHVNNATATTTVHPTATVTHVMSTVVTVTSGTTCYATVTAAAQPFTTSRNYVSRPAASATQKKRDQQQQSHPMPTFFADGCKICSPAQLAKKVSSACSCFLTKSTTTVTATHTAVVTATGIPITQVANVSSTSTVTQQPCTFTSTATVSGSGAGGGSSLFCGVSFTTVPTASTSGSITCSPMVPTPSANVLLRIEGNANDGTIFEGCITSGPRNVTTPSGGTHECDGTNDGANPAPGTVPTVMLDAAAKLNGFGYDGTYESEFQDYLITSIAQSTQTSTDSWGILVDGQFTPVGGCEYEVSPGDRALWAFNAFNYNGFLHVTPDYAVAQANQGTVTVTIAEDQSGNAVSGASFGSAFSNSNGQATIPVPATPGCYQIKATKNGLCTSNAFYLTVVEQF